MSLYLKKLHLKNFRCFESIEFDIDGPLIVIQGPNGSGKTSFLEALHYLGYLRSFKTRIPKELIRFGQENFLIKATSQDNEIIIGCSASKRHVKINKKNVISFQDLWNFHRILTVSEDDLEVVKGAPEKRRTLVDGFLALQNSQYSEHLKIYKQILDNRNALLHNGHTIRDDEFTIWTKKLWEQALIIQKDRQTFLETLETTCNEFNKTYFNDRYSLSFSYKPKIHLHTKKEWDAFHSFWKTHIRSQELYQKRTLFGAHVDDISILFQKQSARIFSSRGQQKLIVMLIKMSLVKILSKTFPALSFLIDDFLTDFDEKIMKQLINALIKLEIQLIFTTPLSHGNDSTLLREYGAKEIILSI